MVILTRPLVKELKKKKEKKKKNVVHALASQRPSPSRTAGTGITTGTKYSLGARCLLSHTKAPETKRVSDLAIVSALGDRQNTRMALEPESTNLPGPNGSASPAWPKNRTPLQADGCPSGNNDVPSSSSSPIIELPSSRKTAQQKLASSEVLGSSREVLSGVDGARPRWCCCVKDPPALELDPTSPTFPPVGGPRKCTDAVCLLIFLLYWAGMAGVAVVGLREGDASRLLYGTDHLGNLCDGTSLGCGGSDQTCGGAVYYPTRAHRLIKPPHPCAH